MKICTRCGVEQSANQFSHRTLPSGKLGLQSHCRSCAKGMKRAYYLANQEREQEKARTAHHASRDYILQRMAAYRASPEGKAVRARLERERKIIAKRGSLLGRSCPKVKQIYETAANITDLTGNPHEVDHIVPLLGRNICGLHVWWNLQVIHADDNRKKGNRL